MILTSDGGENCLKENSESVSKSFRDALNTIIEKKSRAATRGTPTHFARAMARRVSNDRMSGVGRSYSFHCAVGEAGIRPEADILPNQLFRRDSASSSPPCRCSWYASSAQDATASQSKKFSWLRPRALAKDQPFPDRVGFLNGLRAGAAGCEGKGTEVPERDKAR